MEPKHSIGEKFPVMNFWWDIDAVLIILEEERLGRREEIKVLGIIYNNNTTK